MYERLTLINDNNSNNNRSNSIPTVQITSHDMYSRRMTPIMADQILLALGMTWEQAMKADMAEVSEDVAVDVENGTVKEPCAEKKSSPAVSRFMQLLTILALLLIIGMFTLEIYRETRHLFKDQWVTIRRNKL